MNNLFYYLLQVIIVSGILYSYYHFFLRNKKFHRYNRFYLLASAGLSIIVPFLNIPVYFSLANNNDPIRQENLNNISSQGFEESATAFVNDIPAGTWFTWQHITECFYLLVALIALSRIIFSLLKIRRIIKQHRVERLDNIHFVNTDEPGTPFSFFRWMFWNRKIELRSEKGEQIFRHELFHIEQKHSWDVLSAELMTVIFWINPFFHLIKRELKAIHEFLADQFAVTENKKWEYAELLLMQALQTKHQLVHPFFHNQIKRRIAMITTSKKSSYQYLRKLMVLPLAAILLAIFAFSYRSKKVKLTGVEKPMTVIIDVGHGGEDPGARAIDGTLEKDIVLAIAQKVKTLNEDANIKIILTRESDQTSAIKDRSTFSNEQKADLLLSLHINSSTDINKNGVEIYIPKKTHPYFSENKILASILMNYCSLFYPVDKSAKQSDRGIWIIDNSNCPSALVEFGYISNSRDLNFMKDPANQDKLAATILQTIDQYATQRKSSDWNERKNVFTDTTAPVIVFRKNASTGKIEGQYNGRTIKEINEYGKTGQLVFIFEKGDLVMLAEDLSTRLRGEFGTDLSSLITKTLEPRKYDVKASIDASNKIFDKVEIEASFPGGEPKWRQYIKAALNQTIPQLKKAPPGVYTVIVQFVVKTDSFITDVRTLTKHGYGMEEEAIRLISKGPRWIPALQNGHPVNAYRKQPVTFEVKKETQVTAASEPINDNALIAVIDSPEKNTIPKISQAELQDISLSKLLQLPAGTAVASIKITMDLPSGKIFNTTNSGDDLNDVTRKMLNEAEKGRIIMIEEIRILVDGKEKKIPARVYMVGN